MPKLDYIHKYLDNKYTRSPGMGFLTKSFKKMLQSLCLTSSLSLLNYYFVFYTFKVPLKVHCICIIMLCCGVVRELLHPNWLRLFIAASRQNNQQHHSKAGDFSSAITTQSVRNWKRRYRAIYGKQAADECITCANARPSAFRSRIRRVFNCTRPTLNTLW